MPNYSGEKNEGTYRRWGGGRRCRYVTLGLSYYRQEAREREREREQRDDNKWDLEKKETYIQKNITIIAYPKYHLFHAEIKNHQHE